MSFIVWFIVQLIVTFFYLFTTMPHQDMEMGFRAFALSFIITGFCTVVFVMIKYYILWRKE